MEILDKNTIEMAIIPHIPYGSRGFEPKVPLYQIIQAILYRLKTGCQWRFLPVKSIITEPGYTWQAVYYHFNRWSKLKVWRHAWVDLLKNNPDRLDLSNINLDGSHTITKQGGECVGYQGRKAAKTTNALYLCDVNGTMLAMSTPQAGQHHDVYEIKERFKEICDILKDAGISVDGLFMNADAGFDCKEMRDCCYELGIMANISENSRNGPETEINNVFDELLYENRYVIERSNAWMDNYKALLIRFEKTAQNWTALNFISFILIFTRTFKTKKKV
jgi:transposase